MNHIAKLQERVDKLKADKAEALTQVDEFMSYLCSEKFQGVDSRDGDDKNWINSHEVYNTLLRIRSNLLP